MPARKKSRSKVQSIQGELELTAEKSLSDWTCEVTGHTS